MYKSSLTYKRGFTFIELLVAFAIIGILMIIVVTGGSATRKSSRVAQRVSDMKKVQSALDLYYANNKSYPSTGGTSNWRSTCPTWGGYSLNNVIPGLVPDYLSVMPSDPQVTPGSNFNCYLYTSNGVDYAFLDHDVTELSNGSSGATYAKYPELVDPVRPTWAWKVASPGGINW
jgi:general secretion pathway protein G